MNLSIAKEIDRYLGNLICAILDIFVLIKKVIFAKPTFQPRSVKRILLIKFWGLGNMVFLMPIFKAVRATFKDAQIDLLTLSCNKNLMETFPHIDSLFLIDTSNFLNFLSSIIRASRRMRKKKYNLLLDFEIYIMIASMLSTFSAARFKVGIAARDKIRGLLYDVTLVYNQSTHITKTYAGVVKKIGVQIFNVEPLRITTTESDEVFVQNFLKKIGMEKDDIAVGMHIGSGGNFIGRRWHKEKFARLADLLIKKYNCKVIFTGSTEERSMVKEVAKLLPKNKNVIDTAGQFSSRQLAYLLGKITIFISNDTGPLHIASCMGTPVVGLYGPNTPFVYGPIGKNALAIYKNLDCSPCITNLNSKTSPCRDFKCTKNIAVEEVMEAAERCLGK